MARRLLAIGIEDQPFEVFDHGLGMVALRWGSLSAAGRWTYEEGEATPLRRVRWKPRPEGLKFGGRDEQKGGGDGADGGELGSASEASYFS